MTTPATTEPTITGSDLIIEGKPGVKLPHGTGNVGDRVTITYGFGITRTGTLLRSTWIKGGFVGWIVRRDPKVGAATTESPASETAEAPKAAAPALRYSFGCNGVRYDERCRICRRVETVDNITEKCADCSR
jgi:hypothetical protein